MKKMIKMLHLYYDLLNLYGENANSKALVKALEKQNVKVQVDFKSLEDDININEYDFIYVGSGSYESLLIAKDNIIKYKNEIKKYIDNNKFILATGNSIELFDNILNFKSKHIDFRIIGEQVYTTSLINKLIIGFQNRDSVIYEVNESNLFEVNKGTGYEPNCLKEGIIKNNFYGTYLLGPILIRNPYLLDYFVKKILKSKGIEYKNLEKDISYKAYDEYLKNFVNNK